MLVAVNDFSRPASKSTTTFPLQLKSKWLTLQHFNYKNKVTIQFRSRLNNKYDTMKTCIPEEKCKDKIVVFIIFSRNIFQRYT